MNVNYRNSPVTLLAIEEFSRPKTLGKWDPDSTRLIYPEETNLRPAVEFLLEKGMLVRADERASIDANYTVADLKKSLGNRGHNIRGSKKELLDRLFNEASDLVINLLNKPILYVCTEEADRFYKSWNERRTVAVKEAKKISYKCFIKGDYVEAHREATMVLRDFYDNRYTEDFGEVLEKLEVNEIKKIWMHKHSVLRQYSEEEQSKILAAIGMGRLWVGEVEYNWMPECIKRLDDSMGFIARLQRHIEICSRIEEIIDDNYVKEVEIEFEHVDAAYCNLCRELEGKVMKLSEIPELPMQGCTNYIGCQIVFVPKRTPLEWGDTDYKDEYGIEESDLVTRLRQLKKMLDESLITNEDYEDAKRRIFKNM